jgi:hypothetical protein
MAVLGHRSPAMSLIYARLSDLTVKQQYQDALAAGAQIAGPAADALLSQRLDPGAAHWLQTDFLKTELEVGHCLRLPAEGPCECDVALTCSKFLTSSDYNHPTTAPATPRRARPAGPAHPNDPAADLTCPLDRRRPPRGEEPGDAAEAGENTAHLPKRLRETPSRRLRGS